MADDHTVLDEVERKILYHLQDDARNTTNADISEAVGLSATTVGQRIKDLEDRGVIEDYHTMVDYETSGFPHRALLFCTVAANDRREVGDQLIEQHGVVSIRELITGECNLHIEIVGRTREEIMETIVAVEDWGVEVVDSEMIKNEERKPFDAFQPE